MSDRFRDPGLPVQLLWSRPILVRCPACKGNAVVAPAPDEERPLYYRDAKKRLTCLSCAYVNETPESRTTYRTGDPVDPFFGAELLLQDDCDGHTLYAYNERHLDLIAQYVSATLRERARFVDFESMLEKPPQWIKDAKNRGAVARSVARMRTLVP